MIISKKISIFLNDGLPKGVREINIDQWSGGAICGPRNKISEILNKDELDGPCVYFLIGESEDNNFLDVYVGEADPFNQRVKDHLRNKDWWQYVVVFFGSNNNPSKTGIEYLESRCVEDLKKVAKCNLKNGNIPALPSIFKHDIDGLEIFCENIKLIMPILGFDIFVSKINEQVITQKNIFCGGKGVKAEGVLLDDGKVIVKKDSTAVKDNAPSFEKHNYKKIKDELIKIGRLIEKDNLLLFTDDYVFDSLSASAAVILARSAQGPKEWKLKDGTELKDLE